MPKLAFDFKIILNPGDKFPAQGAAEWLRDCERRIKQHLESLPYDPMLHIEEPEVPGDFTCPRRAENGMDDENSPFVLAGKNKDTYNSNGCSYCGSMSGDEFMTLARAGVELIPTDKSYKVYVRQEGKSQQKFYFPHLTVDQRKEFVVLLGQKKLKLAYPGRFYTLPFFVQMVKPDA